MANETIGVHAWVEVGVAVILLFMAVGGTYMTLDNEVVSLQSRVEYLETEAVRKDQRSYEVMTKLTVSVDRLNINMARIEERLRVKENN